MNYSRINRRINGIKKATKQEMSNQLLKRSLITMLSWLINLFRDKSTGGGAGAF